MASPRNIVLCSDGTGNSGTSWTGTNVWKTFKAVARYDHELDAGRPQQVAFYDQGVGTSMLSIKRILGGAFGWGLGHNIRELYTALAKHYRPGDKIFVFGFSRGAFTARSLAGMISDVGIVDGSRTRDEEELDALVGKAYKAYRAKDCKERVEALRKSAAIHDARVHFVGVWDTVDAIGVPVDELREVIYWVARRFLRPHNDRLTDKMDHVYHAIALDDNRHTFSPSVYDESEAAAPGVHQVWFAGAHSNVGGGYPRQGLSDVALDWMMTAAEAHGLRFDPELRDDIRRDRDVHSTLYDSRSGPAAYYRYLPRDVGELCRKANTKPKIHVTALERIRLATADYAPINLPVEFEVVGTLDKYAGADEQSRQQRLAFEQSQIQEMTERCKDSIELRRDAIPACNKEVGKRRWLYRFFLTASLAFGALAIYLMVDPEGAVDWYRSWSLLHRAWVGFWGALATEAPGWLSTLGGWLGSGLVALTPPPLQNLVKGLLQLPEALAAIFIVGLGLSKLKKKRVASMRHLGLGIWRKVFAER